jgi:hypothetical protein
MSALLSDGLRTRPIGPAEHIGHLRERSLSTGGIESIFDKADWTGLLRKRSCLQRPVAGESSGFLLRPHAALLARPVHLFMRERKFEL